MACCTNPDYILSLHQYGYGIIVSSEIETLHPARNAFSRKVDNSKELQEVPEINQIHQAPLCQNRQ